jgi:hypothetical protein
VKPYVAAGRFGRGEEGTLKNVLTTRHEANILLVAAIRA